MKKTRRTLILALGNDILGDDGIGFHAARLLHSEFSGEVDVVETSESGLALLDHLEHRDRAIVLDAVATGKCLPGTILCWDREDFRRCVAPSQHAAGLPHLLELAERLKMKFPKEMRVVCMEVGDPTVFRETLTPEAKKSLPAFVAEVRRILLEWRAGGKRGGSRRIPTISKPAR
jgi:hydrogenase maturation protease